THVTLEYHKLLDRVEEKQKGNGAIGTTGRGIGTTYVDKYSRIGIRVSDFLDEVVFREKLRQALEIKNYLLKTYYGQKPLDFSVLEAESSGLRDFIRPMATDVASYLNQAIKKGKNVLAEGAQGTFLDVDFGTYPYVTASNPISGGACTGLGLPPHLISRVIGVAKAYTTRVGEGPFPTELHGDLAERLRNAGSEFGATTGRPRRCGWFDAVLVRYACRLNGCHEIVITKLDILSGLEKIRVAVAYRHGQSLITEYPLHTRTFREALPIYEEMEGWPDDLSRVRTWQDLPGAARRYLRRIEELVETPIKLVSVGVGRKDILSRQC
ncbi:MAG TPA: adenylosuccinate synthase, partial [bacterium]|nr:adenylosuccinate synthase [bacterium]